MRVLISAAEPSGDRLAAGLVRQLQQRQPSWIFAGITGPELNALGVQSIASINKLSVMGLWELLPKLLSIWRLRRKISKLLPSWDALITVDSSSFNRPLLRAMRLLNKPSIGVVSPQVWASRPQRAAQLPKEQDLLLCLFEFETALYPEGFAQHVGHPVIDELSPRAAHNPQLFGLLPGSRAQEIRRHLPIFLKTAAQIQAQIPQATFLISTPSRLENLPKAVRWVPGGAAAMTEVRAALTKSGTVTLELARMGVPMVVAHQVSPITWWLGKRLLITPWIALPNILSKREVVPEFMQHLDAECLAEALMTAKNQQISLEQCGTGGAYSKMAEHCERLLQERT